MRIEAFRDEHYRGEIHRPSPELREQRRLDTEMADVGGIGMRLYGWDVLLEGDADGPGAGSKVHPPRLGQQIARREVPVLALAAVRRQLDRLAVRALEDFVEIEHGLDGVVAR